MPTSATHPGSREPLLLAGAAGAAVISAILAFTPAAPAIGVVLLLGAICALLARRAAASAGRARLDADLAPLRAELGAPPEADAAALAGRAAATRRQAEAAVAERDDRQRLLDTLDDPIVVTDRAGIVRWANEPLRRLIGARAGATAGRPIDELFTQPELLEMHARAVKGAGGRSRLSVQGSSGARTLEVSAIARPDGGAMLTLRDITDLTSAVHVRTDFVANASHELRTPVAAVRAAVDTLHAGADDDPAMRARLLDMIANHVERLEDLIRDLLDLSRLEAMEGAARLGPAPASEIVRILEPAFEELCAKRGVTLSFEVDEKLERMRTDRNLLILILRNLIENAIKFSKPGGAVRVVAAPATIQRDNAPAAFGVRFDVIDSGVGIPLNQQQRIFERFYQVDEARTGPTETRGTGLGLAIVKHAVRTLGGAIRVRSVWQQGTTMTVELPGALPAAQPAAAASGK
ncbi:MAG: ATP-binding protein [Phycisphaerales bacterium JB039]